jgi:hypothetical protein
MYNIASEELRDFTDIKYVYLRIYAQGTDLYF